MTICLGGGRAPLHEQEKLRDCSVETVEVIEEGSEEMVLRAHPAMEGPPIEESCDLLRDVDWPVVIANCSPLSSHRFPDPRLPPQSSPAHSLDHHHRPSCASYSSSAPFLLWIGSPLLSTKSFALEILLIYSSS